VTGLSALLSLTLRGRGLVAVGLVAAVLGVLAGQRDLMRVGALLLALPCLALAVLARGRVRLSCTRELSRTSVPEGGEVQVQLRVENVSRLTTGLLLLSDRLPRALGDSPRFLLAPVQPGRAGEVSYAVRGGLRGRYEVGPLSVRLADPFGLCELVRVFPGALPLVVTPAVEALPAVRLGGDRAAAGESGSRSMAAAGDEDFSTREWRQGDDLRKVHWRSTARTGELMVRQEEQLSRARAVLLVDARPRAHTGSGAASTLEAAVRAVASVGVHVLRGGTGLRLLPVGAAGPAEEAPRGARRSAAAGTGPLGPRLGQQWAPDDPGVLELDGEGAGEFLLEHLAVLRPGADRGESLGPALATLSRSGSRETLLVAVLGRLDVADADLLTRLRTGSRTCVAVVTAPGQGAGPGGVDPVDLLRSSGWRVLLLPPRGGLASVWPELGAVAGAGAAGAVGTGGTRAAAAASYERGPVPAAGPTAAPREATR
jgi:uncharacterized protein (DUF58 family)